jgi:hypothetical protein
MLTSKLAAVFDLPDKNTFWLPGYGQADRTRTGGTDASRNPRGPVDVFHQPVAAPRLAIGTSAGRQGAYSQALHILGCSTSTVREHVTAGRLASGGAVAVTNPTGS